MSAENVPAKLDQIEAIISSIRTDLAPPPITSIRLTPDRANELDAVLRSARNGSEIVLATGTYPVNAQLPATTRGLTIRSEVDYLALPRTAGGWIDGPAVAGHLARLVPKDPAYPIVTALNNAADHRLLALEIGPNFDMPDRSLMWLGDPTTVTALSQCPTNIDVDLCYVHGDPVRGGHQGMLLGAIGSKITRCYVGGFLEIGRDSQAISTYNGPGPYLMQACFLESSGENFLCGGADSKIPDLIPTDITLDGVHCFKPLAWKANKGSVKNLLEFKLGRKIRVRNSVFENCWTDQQTGDAVLFTVRNQNGGNPWNTIDDVVFEYNVIRNVEGFYFNVQGLDNEKNPKTGLLNQTVRCTNLTLQHVLGRGGKAGGIQVLNGGFTGMNLNRLTLLDYTGRMMAFASKHPLAAGTFSCIDSVLAGGENGIMGEKGELNGTTALLAGAPGASFNGNVVDNAGARQPAVNYPPANFVMNGKFDSTHFDARGRFLPIPDKGYDADEVAKRIPWAKLAP
jgi:hypothetical protein